MDIDRYQQKQPDIEKRLQDFRDVYSQPDEEIFAELCFCLLTPQTKAKSADYVIKKLKEKSLLLNGNAEQIKVWMAPIRFNNNKSSYIVEARKVFSDGNGKIKIKEILERINDTKELRLWLVQNVKGYGLKEASHFLRNIGFGDDIAILDRHILKHLVKNGVIMEVPKSITDKKYFEIENRMREFSRHTGIPMTHLDLFWWSEEAGEIFK